MPAIRGLTVAVGEHYARTLEICLAANMRHLTECVVITTEQDDAVRAVVEKVPGARLSVTDAFYRHGARFNKNLALEEAGFDFMGRHGWICIWDADILFGDSVPLDLLDPAKLHGARRRILEDPSRWSPDLNWKTLPLHRDGNSPIGFCQIFNADAIANVHPWYDVSFGHCGGGDARFLAHWPSSKRTILPMDVLHLGIPDLNWFGCDEESRDLMAKFVTENGWRKAAAKFTPEQVARAGEVPHRVNVPGYAPSDFELPFVNRNRANQARRQEA